MMIRPCHVRFFLRPVSRDRGWRAVGIKKLHNAANSDQVTSHEVEVDGTKLHYVRAGTGKKVILLMPGAMGSAKTDFQHQIDNMDRGKLSLVAWDPPGYGFSRPPDREWTSDFLRRDAKFAAKLMESIGMKKYSLAGWSDGGITALLLTLMHPERIERLIIWGASTSVTDVDVKVNESIRNIDNWSPRMRAPFEAMYGDQYFRKLCSEWVDAFNGYAKVNNGDICSKEISKIKCPTLIIHGQKDALVGQFHPDYIHANITRSMLVNLPLGKHNLHMKFHTVFNDLVQQFILNPDQLAPKL